MKLIIFDVDGVLRDSAPAGLEGMRRGFVSQGIEFPFSLKDYRTIRSIGKYNNSRNALTLMLALTMAGKGVPSSEGEYDSLVQKHVSGKDEEFIDKARSEYKKFFYSQEAGKFAKILPGVEDALKTLEKYTLTVWSNASKSTIERDMKPIIKYFSFILGGEDVMVKKPSPEGINIIYEKLCTPAGETAYVGDTQVDIQAAKAAGCTSIILLSEAPDRKILKGADLYFNDISEMSKEML
ncbi:MAG: HAD-IA family hydrolase [Candidatus Aenigmarchaeota archaeon]|nr:HAD-IA family hydrolase [Candidatus Aenigmarchaeota archaeon]